MDLNNILFQHKCSWVELRGRTDDPSTHKLTTQHFEPHYTSTQRTIYCDNSSLWHCYTCMICPGIFSTPGWRWKVCLAEHNSSSNCSVTSCPPFYEEIRGQLVTYLLGTPGLGWHGVDKMSQWCGNVSIIILYKIRHSTLVLYSSPRVVLNGIVLLSSEHCLNKRTSSFWGRGRRLEYMYFITHMCPSKTKYFLFCMYTYSF